MLHVYFAFEGPTGNILSYFGNTEKAIGNLTVTRTGMGQYSCSFLTGHQLKPYNQHPIIQVSSAGPSENSGINNIVSSSFTFIPTNYVFSYQISLNIETFGVTVDPPIMMVSYTQYSSAEL